MRETSNVNNNYKQKNNLKLWIPFYNSLFLDKFIHQLSYTEQYSTRYSPDNNIRRNIYSQLF